MKNSFCLFSLAKSVWRSKHRVSPEGESKKNKALLRRSSNVLSLVLFEDDITEKGTALFIASTLLQREAVETLVPMQAAAILSLLYAVNVKSNSLVSSWTDEDYTQTMIYIGVDLGVEAVVFGFTVLVLRRIYPEFDVCRILIGLIRMHWVEMVFMSFSVWIGNLAYQSTYSGLDMSLRFSWLSCNDVDEENKNSTMLWLGGFDWDC